MRTPHHPRQSHPSHLADSAIAAASRAVPPRAGALAIASAPPAYRDAVAAAAQGPAAARRGPAEPPAGRSLWSSDQLFGDRHEIEIAHGASVYRLRVTSLGKLILTK